MMTHVAFSPDGIRIVSASAVDNAVWLWDGEKGGVLGRPLEGHGGSAHSVAFSPDSKRIVSGSSDKSIHLWDAEMGELSPLPPPLKGPGRGVHSVALSPDGKCIVSGSDNGTVQLWGAERGESLGPPLVGFDHTVGPITSVAFSPGSERVMAHSLSLVIRLWDVGTGELLPLLPQENRPGLDSSAEFSPDGRRITFKKAPVRAAGLLRRSWDQLGHMLRPFLEGPENHVWTITFSPDGGRIVLAYMDGTIRLCDVKTGQQLQPPLEGHRDWVRNVAFSQDGKLIVSGSDDKTIRVWDVDPEVRFPLKGAALC